MAFVSHSQTKGDCYYMNLALTEAEKGRGSTSPNPIVGACVVKNNKLVSTGHHKKFGAPHAEVEAIRKAGLRAKNSTLYVTLEPCSTFGKTPPCTDLIKASKIKRIVIAAMDPNPSHSGRAVQILKKAGVKVETGILNNLAVKQNQSFFKWVRKKVPFVTLKMAQSLDGKIALKTGESRWITGAKARNWVHQLRACSDAVLVGKNTVMIDDPRLTVRGRFGRQPWRIILDTKAEIPPTLRIFDQKGPVLVVCAKKFLRKAIKKFQYVNVSLLGVERKKNGLNLHQLLKKLGEMGIASLLVEGGGEIAWSFLDEGLVDQVKWVVAPKLIGGRMSKTSVEGEGVRLLKNSFLLRNLQMTPIGDDLLFESEVG